MKRKKIVFALTLIMLVGVIFGSKVYFEPYYNAHFTHYGYRYPESHQRFVVGVEPHDMAIPKFLGNLLKLAFHDREIVFTNNQPPHLIVRSEHISTQAVYSQEYQKWNAPYITLSGERWTIKPKKYRRNAPPLAEIVSTTPKKKRELYFPFMIWCGLFPEKIYSEKREKFLVYIASNCVKQRDKLFALIKDKNQNAQALGLCSNPTRTRYPADWSSLDQVYAQYNFGFAMENHQTPGYITEKIINVFRGGSIPIYWGDSETVKKYFNPKAFIDIGAFESLEKAAEYIVALSQDTERMEQIRQEPIFQNGKIPDVFYINRDPNHILLQEAAHFIRDEYFKSLEMDHSLIVK